MYQFENEILIKSQFVTIFKFSNPQILKFSNSQINNQNVLIKNKFQIFLFFEYQREFLYSHNTLFPLSNLT
jgi:hypothetical protein